MYFLVFAAFAIVLSVPPSGPPWSTLTAPWATYSVVGGQILLTACVAAFYARKVRNKLERDPAWLPGAQSLFANGGIALRVILAVGLLSSIYGTDWVRRVHGWRAIAPIWGLDDLVVVAPLFAAILVGWIFMYPADRAIRQVQFDQRLRLGMVPRPIWRIGAYLSFMLRQHVLIIAAPMIPIVVASDYVARHARAIRQWTHVEWGDDAARVVAAGVVFLFAPVMLRYIWHTRILPPGELRAQLERMCARVGLRYRRILVWETDGMVVNAAVMGLIAPVRYIMLSDGLLEMMEDRKIEAVFGHEAGHVKHYHIHFFMLFAVLSMFFVGGVMELLMWSAHQWPRFFPHQFRRDDYLQIIAMVEIVVVWALGFGYVSRRFECEADLFGANSVTPPAEECDQPCLLHGTAAATASGSAKPVCASAALLFAEALHRIADLNGIPLRTGGWRHPSIAERMKLLQGYAHDPFASARVNRTATIIKWFLFIGTIVGLTVATWLYWPRQPVARPARPPSGGLIHRTSTVNAQHEPAKSISGQHTRG